MHSTINNLLSIENDLKDNHLSKIPQIVAVSKTFAMNKILPLINHGHIHFGENKIQEAIKKWSDIKKKSSKIKLHMVGKCQSNKAKYLIPLFDYLHSLDSIKLAQKISEEEKKHNKKIKIFIQVNIGKENQKSGLEIDELKDFYEKCTKNLNLNVIGIMCIPPNNNNSSKYFSEMQKLSIDIGVKNLSMGMSNDYKEAAKYGSTYIRIGSKIFGERG